MTSGIFARFNWLVSLSTGVMARIIQLATGLVSILLLVKSLSPIELGLFYMWSAIGIALNFIALYFLTFPIQRLMPSSGQAQLDFLASALRPTLAISLLFAGGYGLLSSFSDGSSVLSVSLLTIGYAGAEAVFMQGTNVASATRDQRGYFFAVLLRSLIILGGLYATVGAGTDAEQALLIYWFGSLVPFLVFLRPFRRGLSAGHFHLGTVREMLHFAWPYMVGQIFRQPIERGDRIIVGLLMGPAAAGQYAVAVDLARRVIQGVTINARLSFVRDVVDAHDAGNNTLRQRSINMILLSVLAIGLPLAGVLSVFGPQLVGPLIGEGLTTDALSILRIVSFAFVLEVLRVYVLALPFELTRQSRFEVVISFCGCVVQTGLLFLFGYFWQLTGFALAVLVTQIMLTALTAYISVRWVSFRFPVMFPMLATVLVLIACGVVQLIPPSVLQGNWFALLGVAAAFGTILMLVVSALGWFMVLRGKT